MGRPVGSHGVRPTPEIKVRVLVAVVADDDLDDATGEPRDAAATCARLRAAREAATATAAELAARSHTRGRKPPRGISLAELGARYDRQRGVAVGATPKRSVLRWEAGQRSPTPEARRLLERALALPRGALDAVVSEAPYHQDRIDRAEREGRGLCEVDCNECEVRADGGPCVPVT